MTIKTIPDSPSGVERQRDDRALHGMARMMDAALTHKTPAARVADALGRHLDATVIPMGDRIVLPCFSPAGTISLAVGLDCHIVYVATVDDPAVSRAVRLLQKITGDAAGYLQTFGVNWSGESETLSVYDRDAHELAAKIVKLRDCCLGLLAVAYVEDVA